MDKTSDVLKALQSQQERNAALTIEELQAARQDTRNCAMIYVGRRWRKSMKRSVVEQQLYDAIRRHADAKSDEWRLTSEIDYHDRRASENLKDRQKARNKKDRAEVAIVRLTAMFQQTM